MRYCSLSNGQYKSLLYELCQVAYHIYLWTTDSASNTPHTVKAIDTSKQLDSSTIKLHGIGNGRSHLQECTHTLGQKIVQLLPLVTVAYHLYGHAHDLEIKGFLTIGQD